MQEGEEVGAEASGASAKGIPGVEDDLRELSYGFTLDDDGRIIMQSDKSRNASWVWLQQHLHCILKQ